MHDQKLADFIIHINYVTNSTFAATHQGNKSCMTHLQTPLGCLHPRVIITIWSSLKLTLMLQTLQSICRLCHISMIRCHCSSYPSHPQFELPHFTNVEVSIMHVITLTPLLPYTSLPEPNTSVPLSLLTAWGRWRQEEQHLRHILPRADCCLHRVTPSWHCHVPLRDGPTPTSTPRYTDHHWQHRHWAERGSHRHPLWRLHGLFQERHRGGGFCWTLQRLWGLGHSIRLPCGYPQSDQVPLWQHHKTGET